MRCLVSIAAANYNASAWARQKWGRYCSRLKLSSDDMVRLSQMMAPEFSLYQVCLMNER